MKKVSFVVILIAIFLSSFTSCQKDETFTNVVALDKVAIQSKVDAQPVLSLVEFRALMKEQNAKGSQLSREEVAKVISGLNLKSATMNEPNVYLFPLDSKEIVVTDEYVIRYSVYFEIDDQNNRVHEYTFSQKYYFVDGVVDMTGYEFDWEFGCPQNHELYFVKGNEISNLQISFVFHNGKRFFYNNNEFNGGTLKLAPIGDGNWYAQGITDDYDLPQNFITGMIDLYNGTNELPVIIQIYSPNIHYYVELDKSLLEGQNWIYLIGTDNYGQEAWVEIPAMYSNELPRRISLGSKFPLNGIQICGNNGCNYYSTENMKISVDPITGDTTYHM